MSNTIETLREIYKDEIEELHRRFAEIREEQRELRELYDEDDPELYYENGLLEDKIKEIETNLNYLEAYIFDPHYPTPDNALYTYPEDTSTLPETDCDYERVAREESERLKREFAEKHPELVRGGRDYIYIGSSQVKDCDCYVIGNKNVWIERYRD